MKAEYKEIWFQGGKEILGEEKTVYLPFGRSSARALIVRRSDGAILGTLHRKDGKLALPGGAIDDGESPAEAVERELREENIQLVGGNEEWKTRIAVSYFEGYQELSVWHIFDVEDAVIGECDENILSRWVDQEEDVWYPFMRERIILVLNRLLPKLARKSIAVA
ncbi:MAG: NUDIX domain-containing protein [Anaerolineales bacterium]|nr:NUDIX domain-containing protein [Anaerolineales bacterium]